MGNFKFKLKNIRLSMIERNPNNPRGKNILEKDKEFIYLKKSISEFGLLVPIVVRQKGENSFQLIDGERRFWAMKELGIEEAPAHVLENRISGEIARNVMFHIHTNRLQWEAFQQCLALEPVYGNLKERFGDDEAKISKELVRLTSTHARTINDRLNFLRWPDDLKELVYEKENDSYWTIVEIEKGFIKPAEANFPRYFSRVPKDKVRKLLFQKFTEGHVHAGTEVRKVKSIVHTTNKAKEQHAYALNLVKELINNKKYSFDEAMQDFQARYPYPESSQREVISRMTNQLIGLKETIDSYDFSQFDLSTVKEKRDFLSAFEEMENVMENLKSEYGNIFDSN